MTPTRVARRCAIAIALLDAVEHEGARRCARQLVVLGRAGELVEAADGGLGDAVGVHRGLHELGVGLEQLRRAQAAQLVLGLGEVAAQPGELGSHGVGLRVEQRQRTACRRRFRILAVLDHVACLPAAPGRLHSVS